MKQRLFATIALIGALAVGGAAVAAQAGQGGPGFGGPGRGHMGGPGGDLGLRGIDLSDSQREQVRSILETNRAALNEVGDKLREAHRALNQAAEDGAGNEATIRSASGAVAAALADEAILRAKIRGEVHGLLTAEQQQQLEERRDARQKRLGSDQQRPRSRRPAR